MGERKNETKRETERACFGRPSRVAVSRLLNIHSFMQNMCRTTKQCGQDQIFCSFRMNSMQMAQRYFSLLRSRSNRSRNGKSDVEYVDVLDIDERVDCEDATEETDIASSSITLFPMGGWMRPPRPRRFPRPPRFAGGWATGSETDSDASSFFTFRCCLRREPVGFVFVPSLAPFPSPLSFD